MLPSALLRSLLGELKGGVTGARTVLAVKTGFFGGAAAQQST